MIINSRFWRKNKPLINHYKLIIKFRKTKGFLRLFFFYFFIIYLNHVNEDKFPIMQKRFYLKGEEGPFEIREGQK